ncbi:AAA family ATPase [Nonomuraea sp. NPDC005501]|uniref:NACHT domain-containing protein n=1 Tax=Nonomuraea sp. NPDC005501 TaxID=3156884 RepID=UPI0033B9B0F4
MRRDPALTYQGALSILGHYERPTVEKLDKLLGGAILSGGMLAGAIAIGVPNLAPLAGLAAVWGWVDQKNEAMGLLRKVVNKVSDHLLGTNGYDRYQLITAAHTTVVAAAFFDALREWAGEKASLSLALSDDEREMLVTGKWRDSRESFFDAIYSTAIPAPSAIRGFEENVTHVRKWMEQLCGRTERFLGGLEAWNKMPKGSSMQVVVDGAVEKYRTQYLQLASSVPEFLVWASMNEHASTRYQMRAIQADLHAAIDSKSVALSRIERLLTVAAASTRAGSRELMNIVSRANKGALSDLIVPIDMAKQQEPISFPTVGQIYVDPYCRMARNNSTARPSSEEWWQKQSIHTDIDLILAAHITSVEATRLPLVVLGHPGAGKSLFTKVLAARLPVQSYTVVRVPLRRVSSDAPIFEQIQQALDHSTHKRVEWHELADESRKTIRVVLLDGLDELLQASALHRASYLLEVAEFQRREAEQQRPVVVVVTSRTLVADRVEIAEGTPLIRLEEFDRDQVASWLQSWNEENASLITEGKIGVLSLEGAMRLRELSSQPLLLMMLALYSSDPSSPPLDADVSSSEVYRHLLENFLTREISKQGNALNSHQARDEVNDRLWHLSIAAFAMFNRGRQDTTDIELGNDIVALNGNRSMSIDTATLGRDLVGRFFFIHTAEAQIEGQRTARRSYEFLHATFAEYLVAAQIIEILKSLMYVANEYRRGATALNDDLLFALLSHQPIAIREQISSFLSEIFRALAPKDQEDVLRLLGMLLTSCRQRHMSERYSGYCPLPLDRVRQIGAYSANLVLLRIIFSEQAVQLSELFPVGDSPRASWASLVNLWRGSLDQNGWNAILDTLGLDGDAVGIGAGMLGSDFQYASYARLIGDRRLESWIRIGMAVQSGANYCDVEESIVDLIEPCIASFMVPLRRHRSTSILLPPKLVGSEKEVSAALKAVDILLKLGSHSIQYESLADLVKWRVSHREIRHVDPYSLASAIWAHPNLVVEIPAIADPELYKSAAGTALLILLAEYQSSDSLREALKRLREEIEGAGSGFDGNANIDLDTSRPEFMLAADLLEAFLLRGPGSVRTRILKTSMTIRPAGDEWVNDQTKPELL